MKSAHGDMVTNSGDKSKVCHHGAVTESDRKTAFVTGFVTAVNPYCISKNDVMVSKVTNISLEGKNRGFRYVRQQVKTSKTPNQRECTRTRVRAREEGVWCAKKNMDKAVSDRPLF